ncbi:MAG: ABC transporter permease [Kiritimatiellales bacterium]
MKESTSHVLAVLKREWKSYFDSPVAYVFIIIFLMLAGFFTFAVSRFFEAGQADLRGFFMWHPWLYMILVPAVAMRLWAEERRSGTIELLFTVSVTPWQAILGKFFAAWLFLILALALTFPVALTAAYLGSPDFGTIAAGYLGSALLAGAYLSAGMFTSALTRNQVISFILAVVIGMFLILAGYPPVTDLLARHAPVWVVDGVAAFSFMPHFETLQRGVIDVRDLLYFASVMIFMLFATQVVLKNKTGR